jgi:hypothetical protein
MSDGNPPLPLQDFVVCAGTTFLPKERPAEANEKLKTGILFAAGYAVRFPMDSFGYFIDYGPWGRLSLVTEMSNRYISRG